MAESKKLITKQHRLHTARQLAESIDEPANTAYYIFFGNHLPYANASNIPQPNDSIQDVYIDVYRNMIYGKRVTNDDVKLMIPRNNYVSNKPYNMYEATLGEANIEFFDSNYYAVVNADAYYHVFKCLDNNQGANSTIQPEFSEVDAQDEVYQTSDGYVWKYMYTADSATEAKFATTEYFPVVSNTQVSVAAKDGLINVIKVNSAGRGYDNYCNGTFRTDDLRLSGNALLYSLNSSLTANTTNTFYNGCYLYISAGTGVGQYAKISNYVVNSTVKALFLNDEFTVPPASDSVYEVSPGVVIVGDGTQTINAEARAIVNSAGNTIQRIEMLNLGLGYKYATAYISVANTVAVDSNAAITPVYSPPGGHGFDAAAELGATRLAFSTKFSNSNVDIPLQNDYRTIGILKDPLFADVTLNINASSTVGSFIPNEKVYKVDGFEIFTTNATINTTSAVITANADFTNQLSQGEYIYIKSSTAYQLAVVNSVSNSSYLTITQNGYFSCTSAQIYKTTIGSRISNVGLSTTALTGTLTINTTSANVIGTSTNFDTQLVANSSYIFVYANSTGGGVLKKVVEVTDSTNIVLDSNGAFANASAKAHVINYNISSEVESGVQSSVALVTSVATGTLLTTNVAGIFETDDNIIGETSGAFAAITSVERSGIAKGFESFVQMYKYTGTSVSGEFTSDESVYQSTTNGIDGQFANAKLHSITGTSPKNYYVTNQIGVFNEGNNMIGANSTSIATITNKYFPELIYGSGEIIYVENIDAITRTNTASETIKLIFEF
jgi:hypothetical protein